MQVTITQVFLATFLLFALSRVYLRFRGGALSFFGFFFWSTIFGLAILAVLFPGITGRVAQIIGIGRGVDAIIYVSITLLFYLIFRLYIYLEDIKHDITEIVQKLALKETQEKKESRVSQK